LNVNDGLGVAEVANRVLHSINNVKVNANDAQHVGQRRVVTVANAVDVMLGAVNGHDVREAALQIARAPNVQLP
jgi:hypothetical protein